MEGERIDNEFRLRQSISNVGGDNDVCLRVESESGLKEASFAEDASDLSSLAQNGRGGLGGEPGEETEPIGILIEFAGRFRPLGDPVALGRPERTGFDPNGTGFLGFSLNEEKQFGEMLELALSERDFPSVLPRLTLRVGGCCHGLLC